MIKFTIIIPHHNSYSTLLRCLQSLPYANELQIIVIDDDSDDPIKLSEIKQHFPYVEYIYLNNNSGAGKARNEGLKRANGKWVIFADADDYFINDFYNVVDSYYDSDSDIIYFKSESRISETGAVADRGNPFNELIDGFLLNYPQSEKKLRFKHYVPWCKMINLGLIKLNEISFEEIRYSNDIMFSAKIGYYAKKIEAINKKLYCVTTNGNSLTRIINKESVICRYEATLRYNSFLASINATEFQAVILKYIVLSLKLGLSTTFEMIELGVKYHTNFFSGLNRWKEIFNKNKRQISHF